MGILRGERRRRTQEEYATWDLSELRVKFGVYIIGIKDYFTRGEVVLLMGCDFCSFPLCCLVYIVCLTLCHPDVRMHDVDFVSIPSKGQGYFMFTYCSLFSTLAPRDEHDSYLVILLQTIFPFCLFNWD